MFALRGKWCCAIAQWCIAPMAQSNVMCSFPRAKRTSQGEAVITHEMRITFRVSGTHRSKNKKAVHLDCFRFWLRRWDLNLMTFGLWARRATRLLHSAILWCRKPGSNRYEKKSHGILSPGRLPIPPFRHYYDLLILHRHYIIPPRKRKVNTFLLFFWKIPNFVLTDTKKYDIIYERL